MRRIAIEITKQLKAQSGNGSGIDNGSNNPNHFASGRKGVNGGGGGLSGMSAEQQQLLQGGSIHPSLLSSQQLQHISASIGVKGNKIPAQPRKPIETTSDGAPIDISSMEAPSKPMTETRKEWVKNLLEKKHLQKKKKLPIFTSRNVKLYNEWVAYRKKMPVSKKMCNITSLIFFSS